MASEALEVGIVVERRRLKNPWAEFAWQPAAVLPGAPAAAAWTMLEESADAARFYLGLAELTFHSSDTAMYRDNLRSGAPSLWVALQEVDGAHPVALQSVTADPAEGEALTEPGSVIVEALPMPAEIQARLAAFVERHHVDRAFFKRRRDRADPEALGRKPRDDAGQGGDREG